MMELAMLLITVELRIGEMREELADLGRRIKTARLRQEEPIIHFLL